MHVVCVNVGSTSFKYPVIDMETTISLVKGHGTYENMASISN